MYILLYKEYRPQWHSSFGARSNSSSENSNHTSRFRRDKDVSHFSDYKIMCI